MITADLHDLGWRVSKNTVAALMAELGLAARPKKRRKGSTRPGKGRWRAPDLVKWDFPAAGINVKWYGDGTDIDTDEGRLVNVSVSGLVGSFVVNDVDVTAFVAGELDRRHPERVQPRAVRTADDYRAIWDTFERLRPDTVARAGRLPEPALHLRVDEWSFVETQRHLVFATGAWVGRTILDEPMPYHRWAPSHRLSARGRRSARHRPRRPPAAISTFDTQAPTITPSPARAMPLARAPARAGPAPKPDSLGRVIFANPPARTRA